MARPLHVRPFALAATLGVLGAAEASALEYPIGSPQSGGGLEVAAVYLQPIVMEPEGMMRAAPESDIHLEADIHALADNANGFAEGEWVPYLDITYELTRIDTGETVSGPLMAMVASDGPHYGDNVSLMGMGNYRLAFTVAPPSHMFGRHIDRETGVAPWFEPFRVEYEFTYAGTGRVGSY